MNLHYNYQTNIDVFYFFIIIFSDLQGIQNATFYKNLVPSCQLTGNDRNNLP